MIRVFMGAFLLASCQRLMNTEPKLKTYGESTFFKNKMAMQAAPANTVSSNLLGQEHKFARPVITSSLMKRGRERFEIFCVVCHSPLGDGQGIVTQRGFPNPPSFHTDQLRNASDQHLYDVISRGQGRMYPMADRIAPVDRWAIVAYVRALQLSQARSKSK